MVQDSFLKCRVEISVIEKHIGVMEPLIEVSLH